MSRSIRFWLVVTTALVIAVFAQTEFMSANAEPSPDQKNMGERPPGPPQKGPKNTIILQNQGNQQNKNAIILQNQQNQGNKDAIILQNKGSSGAVKSGN